MAVLMNLPSPEGDVPTVTYITYNVHLLSTDFTFISIFCYLQFVWVYLIFCVFRSRCCISVFFISGVQVPLFIIATKKRILVSFRQKKFTHMFEIWSRGPRDTIWPSLDNEQWHWHEISIYFSATNETNMTIIGH